MSLYENVRARSRKSDNFGLDALRPVEVKMRTVDSAIRVNGCGLVTYLC